MHGIRHDQARANKGVDLIESPRAPPTHERDESITGDPLIFHACTALTSSTDADITPPLNSGYRAA